MDFIDCLVRTKDLSGLTDGKFAVKLGVDPSTWSLIKRRRNRPGTRFLQSVVREFPELEDAVSDYLGIRRNYLTFAPRFFMLSSVKSLLDKLLGRLKATDRVDRCAACGKELKEDDISTSLGDKKLCRVCFYEGWRLTKITYRGERKPRRLTVAYKPLIIGGKQ